MTFLMIAVVYLFIGTFIARNVHAYQRAISGVNPEKIRELKAAVQEISHGRDCYQNPVSSYYSAGRDCDCSCNPAWKTAVRELSAAKAGGAGVNNPYTVLTFWPLLGYHKFLTSGKVNEVNKFDPELVARMEKELKIEAGNSD